MFLWCTVRGAGIEFKPGNYIVLLGFQFYAGFSHCVLWDHFFGDVLCFVLVKCILSIWNIFYNYRMCYIGVRWRASELFYRRRMGAPFVE